MYNQLISNNIVQFLVSYEFMTIRAEDDDTSLKPKKIKVNRISKEKSLYSYVNPSMQITFMSRCIADPIALIAATNSSKSIKASASKIL